MFECDAFSRQHRLLRQLLRLPVHRVLRPHTHPELHLQPAGHRRGPLHRHQEPTQVRGGKKVASAKLENLKQTQLYMQIILGLNELWPMFLVRIIFKDTICKNIYDLVFRVHTQMLHYNFILFSIISILMYLFTYVILNFDFF